MIDAIAVINRYISATEGDTDVPELLLPGIVYR
jgi:hypothetical protein